MNDPTIMFFVLMTFLFSVYVNAELSVDWFHRDVIHLQALHAAGCAGCCFVHWQSWVVL